MDAEFSLVKAQAGTDCTPLYNVTVATTESASERNDERLHLTLQERLYKLYKYRTQAC